jgi:hypothetical protein
VSLVYAVLFQACLASNPAVCESKIVRIDTDHLPSQTECFMYGQITMAKWQEQHPSLIARPPYRCVEMYPTGGEMDT